MNLRRAGAVAMLLVLGAPIRASAQDQGMVLVPGNAAVKWQPGFPTIPKWADLAVLYGDPSKVGEPFVLRVRFPADKVIAPHSHPTPESLTVVEGDIFHAMGETVDKSKGQELKQGGFVFLPAKTTHYLWTKQDTVLQINGVGPFQVLWTHPEDDPKNAK